MSDNIMKPSVLLVGSGPMAVAYAKVLQAMDIPFVNIGRGQASADNFEKETRVKPVIGGVDGYLANNQLAPNTVAFLATNTEGLMHNMLKLLEAGADKILVEKPAAISVEELLANEENLKPYNHKVFVAYNRRFYSSVIEAEKMIEEDGGLQSMLFEFTEWAHVIEPLKKAPGIKENWFFANSTHVVDLAFYLAGSPAEMSCYSKAGSLTWHSKTNFAGAGITEKGVLFSYLSNWESAGRWALELLTSKRRIYLKPLEGINVQLKGSVQTTPHEFDNALDTAFKPGIYKQVEAFLNGDDKKLLDIEGHIVNTKNIYSTILS